MGAESESYPTEDFVFTSSKGTHEQVRDTLAAADAPPATTPPVPDASPAPAADSGEPPAAATGGEPEPDAVTTAAQQLPKGDSEAGRTLSQRARVIQAEIHQLTAQKYQSRAEADAARAELDALRSERQRLADEMQAARTPPAAPAAAKPVATDFATFEEYTDALGQYYRDEAKRESVAEVMQQVQQQWAQQRAEAEQQERDRQLQTVYAEHQQRLADTRAAHPDFDELVTGMGHLKTNPMMDTHILRSTNGGELMHYLATHPDECEAIAALPSGPTLVALGRLEARIDGAKSGPPSARSPVSRAQPPIKPVGTSSASADEPPGSDSSLDEHVTYWNRKERERRAARR